METSDFINPCESSLYDCLTISVARTFANKNHIKIKIICHRFMENECIWEGTSFMNACYQWSSQYSITF